mgnify:CR=1 FL=1
MKRTVSLLLALVMVFALAACSKENNENKDDGSAGDVEMKYMTADETAAILGTEGYTILDLRKSADYAEAHITGAVSADMDAAVNGDAEAGKSTMKAAAEGLDDTLVLVCYSGKRYAQAATNALSANGYDMSKVFTLEGGFNNWKEVQPDNVEP